VDRRLEEMADRELTEPAAANEGIRRSISAACCGKATNSMPAPAPASLLAGRMAHDCEEPHPAVRDLS